jgi:two-component system, OmpR family, alkaline phosphatase synthesis response regulator PhoP
MPERILIVEDDPIFRSLIEDNLISEGYRVDTAIDGAAALACLRSTSPDLILLDLTLPDWDGLELCPLLRRNKNVSIIILSARGQKLDKLQGLRLGADDYIVKPTDMEELIERIKAVLRRTRPRVDRLQLGSCTIDFRTQRVLRGHTVIHLTFHEFKLLEYLAQRPFQVVPREELLTEVWGYLRPTVVTRSVDQTVVRLRKKLELDPHNPVFIHTAPGVGYSLHVQDSE